jgi:hypothetical protein
VAAGDQHERTSACNDHTPALPHAPCVLEYEERQSREPTHHSWSLGSVPGRVRRLDAGGQGGRAACQPPAPHNDIRAAVYPLTSAL